jgi:hypothetical protein
MAWWAHPTLISVWAFLLGAVAEGWYSWDYLTKLRRTYPLLWERSGRRTIWTDGTIIDAWPTIRFLWRREYLAIANAEERGFFERYRMPMVVSWALSGIAVIAFLASVSTLGWPNVGR